MNASSIRHREGESDTETWREGLASLVREYSLLPPGRRDELGSLLAEAGTIKEELCRLSSSVGGEDICAACGGACCRAGRYHATALDLLAYLAAGDVPVEPDFESGGCPFLGEAGCRTVPSRRPFTCVIFICDRINDRLDAAGEARALSLEHRLRQLLRRLGENFGTAVTESFLIAAGRTARDGGTLLELND